LILDKFSTAQIEINYL